MRRIKLIVAYDGTNYCGWQVQPNGITVQEVLNQALSDLFAKKTACIGASRTDAGVHALGNVAVFDTDARMPADRIAFALNTRLPAISVFRDHPKCRRTFTRVLPQQLKRMNIGF